MNTDNRASIAAKIRALLAKTTAAGCTEGEMLAALDAASRLSEKYNIGLDEASVRAEGTVLVHSSWADDTPMVPAGIQAPKRRGGRAKLLSPSAMRRMRVEFFFPRTAIWRIGAFTSTRIWREPNTQRVAILGTPADCDFALWLHDALTRFCENQATAYFIDCALDSAPCDTASFTLGICARINERLDELVRARREAPEASSTALVPATKDLMIREHMARLGITLQPGRSYTIRDERAFGSGRAAGDAASFGRPVGASASSASRPKLLS